ncbi:MAG: fumarylacetoacetate hydrolase family protein [Pseudomonadota bacterium]
MTTPLTDAQQLMAADTLLAARRSGEVIADLPAACKPQTLADALAIRDLVFAGLGEAQAGWFVGCSNPHIQRQLGLDEPYCAQLAAGTVHPSPAELPAGAFPSITLEVEFAFTLARDLAPRETPYGRAEVADAIDRVHPAIEVVTSHLADWTRQSIFNIIADNGTDGALVFGPGAALSDAGDLSTIRTSVSVNGEEKATGSGADVLGDPLNVMVWLANRSREDGVTLNAGQIHNTGSTTPMVLATPGDTCRAVFEGLGPVEVTFSAP